MIMEDYDDVIFDDEFDELEQIPEPIQEEEPKQQEDDLTQEVLRMNGISDLNKIKFEDESGAIVERSWDSLTREEQLGILTGQTAEEDELSQEEIDLLNNLRQSGLSVEDWLQSLMPTQQPSYKIDDLSDEDVYALDLLEKVGEENITDEELAEAIENAKKNEALFKKTVEGLRKEYIKLQQDEEARAEQEYAAQQQEMYNNWSASIIDQIQGLNSFAGQDLELSDEEKQNLANYTLQIDNNGTSAFGRDLQNPQLFAEAAFWLLNKEAIAEELTKQIQDSYKRGFEAGKRGNSQVVFTKPKSTNTDDFVDDEDW
jgi:hypothetical protein